MKEAKEKAKELFDKFSFNCRECDNAKQCAILSVEEVLKLGKKLPLETLEYYLEVKIELEKL